MQLLVTLTEKEKKVLRARSKSEGLSMSNVARVVLGFPENTPGRKKGKVAKPAAKPARAKKTAKKTAKKAK